MVSRDAQSGSNGPGARDPYTFPIDAGTMAIEQATKLLRGAESATEQAARMDAVEVGTTPSEVVYRENKLELLRYEPLVEETHDVPILVAYALINRPYILDLQPERSVVRRLLEAGFEVYLIDWDEPSRLDASLTLDDYVDRYIENCVDVVREREGVEDLTLLGYCMGGTMSAMYAAQHPEKVRNLVLMAAGLSFDDDAGILELWGDEEYYDPGTVVETFGNVPASFLDVGFALMDPVDNFMTKYVRLFENLEDDEYVENFARMETWLSDGVDVAGAAYRQFLEDLYQDDLLMANELYLDGEHVDVENITMPTLQIVGTYDHLVPPTASKPFTDRIPAEDTEIMEFPVGHIGLSVSGRSHAELWPNVAEWLADRSTAEPADPGLQAIRGIGPAYTERLQAYGIETVGALAEADPAAVAEGVDVPESVVRDWIGSAEDLLD